MFSERIEGWKNIMAGFAIFGFILSFILGLVGGVMFGVILLRAFLFAAMFAGISLVIMKIIENFVPEFLERRDYEEDSENSGSSVIIEDETDENSGNSDISGRNLDITIEDGDENEEFEPIQYGRASSGRRPGRASGSNKKNPESEEDSDSEFESPLEELEGVGDSDTGDEGHKKSVSGTDADGADNGELPDIGVYSDSFETEDDSIVNNSEGLSSIDGSGSSGGAEILGSMHDTQEIVKAVKTVLKKNQEG